MSVDLGAYLEAVPAQVVERLRGARRVLAVGHENPDADTLGATLAVTAIVEACGGRADPVCTDPVPELYGFLAGIERFRTDPTRRRLRPARDLGLRHARSGGRRRANGMPSSSNGCLASSSTTTRRTTTNAGPPTGSIRPPPPRARWPHSSPLASAFRSTPATGRWRPRSWPASSWTRPRSPIRTRPRERSSYRRRLSKRARHCPTSRAASTARSRNGSSSCSAACSTGWPRARTGGSCGPRWKTPTSRHRRVPSDAEGIIDLLAQAETAEVAILFKEAAGGTRLSVRTKPGGVDATVLTGRFGGGGHAARLVRRSSSPRTRHARSCSPRRPAWPPADRAERGTRIARARV